MTNTPEKLLGWSLKGHIPGCQFHFAPLDTCDCTRTRMQDRVDELEHSLGMVAAYLKDMTERGDGDASNLLDMLDLDEEEGEKA
jgi:hypothetical protein